MIRSMLAGKPLPVYGDGKQIRDWIHVDDHNRAVWMIAQRGENGGTYNISANNELENIVLVRSLCAEVARQTGKDVQEYLDLITFVTDRAGHDRRYAMDSSMLQKTLNWHPMIELENGLAATVRWYIDHQVLLY